MKQYYILLSSLLTLSLYGGITITIVNNTSYDFQYTLTFNPYQAVCTTSKTDTISAKQTKEFDIGSCCVQQFMVKSTNVNTQGQFIEKSITSSMAKFGVCWNGLTFTINETNEGIVLRELERQLKQ
jgi:hypothetical protein